MGNPQEPSRNYDPNPFNVRQYEDEYGPGGVPKGYTFHGKTPLQNPNGIRVVSVFMLLMGGFLVFLMIKAGPAEPSFYGAGAMALGAWAMATWGFIIANRRQKWLTANGVPRKEW